jgi:hypothetical protein
LGPIELQVFVSPEKERTDEVDAGPIRITDFRTMATTIMNPKNKSALVVPPPPKPPEQNDKNDPGRFFDREPAKDGLVTISMGVNTPNGKEWMVQTTCRPDGIWVERKVKTPKGLLTMRQRDIKIEAIPAAQFEVPGDYKVIQPPPPPPAGKK